jgi:hypothetical protein
MNNNTDHTYEVKPERIVSGVWHVYVWHVYIDGQRSGGDFENEAEAIRYIAYSRTTT